MTKKFANFKLIIKSQLQAIVVRPKNEKKKSTRRQGDVSFVKVQGKANIPAFL